MPEELNTDTLSKKEQRKQKREEKIQNTIETDAGKYGINLNDSSVPVTEDSKQRITKNISDIVGQEQWKEIGGESFSKAYSPGPTQLPEVKPNVQALTDQERKAKRKKWAEVLYAFGQGVGGRPINQELLPSYKAKQERESQFASYKDATLKNQIARSKWDEQYRNDLLDFIDEQQKNANLSRYEQAKYDLIKAQIGAQKALARQRNVQADWQKKKPYGTSGTKASPIYTEQLDGGIWQMTNQDNPYSDLYYKLTGNSPVVINEIAKLSGYAVDEEGQLKRNLSKDEVERFSNTLLSSIFDIKTDENGNRFAQPKPGKENYLNDLSDKIQTINELQATLQQLNDDKSTERYNEKRPSGKSKIDAQYDPMIKAKESEIKSAQSELQGLLSGEQPKETKPESKAPKYDKGGSVYDNILNKYKTK